MGHGKGRIRQPDERDRAFLMRRVLSPAPTAGSKLWPSPMLYDQGDTPECTAYSASGWMSSREGVDRSATIGFEPAGLYAWAQAHDGIPMPHDGSTVRAAFDGLVKQGDLVAASSDPADLAVGSEDRIATYLWADTSDPAAAAAELAQWLLTKGAAVIGCDWYEGMEDPDVSGYLHPTGNIVGGHAILVRGYNGPARAFCLRNSWGAWGCQVTEHPDGATWQLDLATPGGDALVSMADMVKLLGDGGEAAGGIDQVLPPSPPAPPAPEPPAPPEPPVPVPPAPGPSPAIQALLTIVGSAQQHMTGLAGDFMDLQAWLIQNLGSPQ